MAKATIHGFDKVMSNLNKELQSVAGNLEKGLFQAGLFIRRESQEEVPVDQGNLRASAFVVGKGVSGGNPSFRGEGAGQAARDHTNVLEEARGVVDMLSRKWEPAVVIGYSANYSIYVHEKKEAVFQKPGAKAKFLEDPIRRNTGKIVRIVAENAKL